jgi:DNA topoisomerase VI subunit B
VPKPHSPSAKPAAPAPKAAPETPAQTLVAAPKSARDRRSSSTAEDMAKKQREISVSEFFTKNRHLLGFDNPRKALLTTVKEAVDNSLDACEEAGILPAIVVEVRRVNGTSDPAPTDAAVGENGATVEAAEPVKDEDVEAVEKSAKGATGRPERFVVAVEDNGPGILAPQIPKVFGKLLYGSKFHRLRQSLTADQPVLVERNGRVERLPIGSLVDAVLGTGEEVADVTPLGWRVPAFDASSFRYEWRPVSHVIRHDRANEILEVATECGKRVRVTGCHSLFTYDAASHRVVEVEARTLRSGDWVVAPRRLSEPTRVTTVNVVDDLPIEALESRAIFIHGIPFERLREWEKSAAVLHRRDGSGRSRRYYRFATVDGSHVDVLDDSWFQYSRQGFLPCKLAKRLGVTAQCAGGYVRTYFHGKSCEVPVTWTLTPALMRFLGFWVAEGHCDRRQVGFTFGSHETGHVDEVVATARTLGLGTTVESRPPSAIRVKVFGGALDVLLAAWAGRGARAKRVPWFVFHAGRELRQHFLDALHQGDGHRVRTRDVLMLSSTSRSLIADVEALWLLHGVVASRTGPFSHEGLGKEASVGWRLDVHGEDLESSSLWKRRTDDVRGNRYRMFPSAKLEFAAASAGTRVRADAASAVLELRGEMAAVGAFASGDLCLLRVRDVRAVAGDHAFVYDLSVPGCENFVAGEGPLACHNSRGQQGIGISAAGMYGQLTTGKPVRILSKTGPKKKAKYVEIHLDTRKNAPEVLLEEERDWDVPHGTRVEIELEAKYQKGQRSVDDYLRQTALANPHVSIRYRSPEGTETTIERAATELPAEPREIKPHPYGVELGFLIQMLKDSESKHLKAFLHSEFSRVTPATAAEICKKAKLSEQAWTSRIAREEADALHGAMSQVEVMNPPTDCVSPIGEESVLKSLEREYPGAVTFAVTRRPAVYRGNPFQIEVAVAFGGPLPAEEPAALLRFANRVPLLYQQSACAVTKAIISCPWRSYGLEQPKGALPVGPLVLFVHLASVWVPFTSESKEAIAHYPEILRDVRLAAMDCGRRLGRHLRREKRIADAEKKKGYIQKYIPHIAAGLAEILALSDKERGKTVEILTDVLERSRTI